MVVHPFTIRSALIRHPKVCDHRAEVTDDAVTLHVFAAERLDLDQIARDLVRALTTAGTDISVVEVVQEIIDPDEAA